MINFNIFSGKTYFTAGPFKQSDDGHTFTKLGDNWIADNGDVIQDQGGKQFNFNTGVMSTFGDAFKTSND